MKKTIYLFYWLLFSGIVSAQDDLLNMLSSEAPQKPTAVYATFKSTRLVNLQSNETMKAKHLDFRIQHRFSSMNINKDNNYGLYDVFGLDGAVIRLGLEYGITDKLMIGLGRSTIGKTFDGFVKYQLLQQKTKGMPMSLVLFGNTGISTQAFADKNRQNFETSRLSYVFQTIITRKMNDYFSFILTPTMVHHNLVETKETPNDIFALGIGTSIKISRSTRFNIEYVPRLNGRNQPKNGDKPTYYDAIAIGFDIETGGHVFQLHFTNGNGLIEQQFIARNPSQFNLTQLRFGFNISRTFSFDK
ncbi:MAG: DUF5777 family beta-barrel protein [Bacteroidota bacterium]